jgi:hypothetical protein
MTEDASLTLGKGIQESVIPPGAQTAILGCISMGVAKRYTETCNGVYGRVWHIMSHIDRKTHKMGSLGANPQVRGVALHIQGIAFPIIIRVLRTLSLGKTSQSQKD